MPATYAHYRFGVAVCDTLPEEITNCIQANKALFSLGLHGPDLLWYDHFSHPSVSATQSHALHYANAGAFFVAKRARFALRPQQAAVCAYLLGFLCHFALDSTAHPYVNRLAEQGAVSHLSLESEFEKMLLRQDGKNPFETDLTAHICLTTQETALVAEVLQVKEDVVQNAIDEMKHYNALSNPVNASEKEAFLADLAARGVSEGYAGLLLAEEDDQRCAESNAQLALLFAQAIPTATTLLKEYWEKWNQQTLLSARFEKTYE